jgi:hypothetical protein
MGPKGRELNRSVTKASCLEKTGEVGVPRRGQQTTHTQSGWASLAPSQRLKQEKITLGLLS